VHKIIKNILLFILIASFFVSKGQIQTPSVGKIVRHADFKSKYTTARNVDVWLPKDYSKKKKYAVIYMHDGQMLFDATITWNKQEWGVDETVQRLLDEKKIKDCIVVGVWNSNTSSNQTARIQDYFPQKALNYIPKEYIETLKSLKKADGSPAFVTEILSDNYLRFLVEELKPFIDKTYSTLPDKDNTILAGASMGGLISMYGLCEYPKVFGKAACLSTHWPGLYTNENNPIPFAFKEYMKASLPNPNDLKIYFDFGTATLDSLYEVNQIRIDSTMRSKGFTDKSWVTRKFEGDEHSEVAWRKRFEIPLLFLLGKEDK
jgi:predicted alpha/beta superfamily hydrolase